MTLRFYNFLLHLCIEISDMNNRNFMLVGVCIMVAAIFRLLPHPPNATPIAAMALMGGLYVSKKHLAFILPLAALLISDIILNNTVLRSFYPEQTGIILFSNYMIATYAAFIITVIIGLRLIRQSAMNKIILGTLLSSIGFFIITNLGVWMGSVIYPKSPAGLIACFSAAIPFFKNTLLGNALFITLFVASIESIKKYYWSKSLA